ncbi:FAS1-like dehydratase domain-containing protein [Paenibacillus lentus]|nr:MaoC family dehydratase N-terminal domain-containing protein [Paenibacillus lentus]
MMNSKWLGASTPTQRTIITRTQIESFLQGFPPLFRCEASRIPFTYPIVLWQSIYVPWLPSEHDANMIIHGQQSFHYIRDIQYNEELFYQIHLSNIRKKKGSQGVMCLLDCDMILTNSQAHPILHANTTLLLLDKPESIAPFSLEVPHPTSKSLLLPDLPELYDIWNQRSLLLPGSTLIDVCLGTITGDKLHAYAKASRDNNTIHLDAQKAHEFGLPGRVAHGMLILGMIGNMLQGLQTENMKLSGLQCRFHAPIVEGDIVYAKVNVQSVAESQLARNMKSPDESSLENYPSIHCSLEVFIDQRNASLSFNSENKTLAYSGSARYVRV